jgi:hypothetical protein
MKEELKKSLTDLIDETLLELEELKKSRFSASEIKIEGPGANELAGKPVNGKLAEKGEDESDEDEDEAEKAEETEKGEGVNGVLKAEDKKDEDKDEPHKDDPDHEEKEKDIGKKLLAMHKEESVKKDEEIAGLKKSLDGMESLMKSYIDEKMAPLQTQMATILEAVNKLANSPAPAKGVSYKGVAPLTKSNESAEPLSKSEVASKLFELKKSGSRVDSTDIARAEMGHDLEKIVAKYNIQ